MGYRLTRTAQIVRVTTIRKSIPEQIVLALVNLSLKPIFNAFQMGEHRLSLGSAKVVGTLLRQRSKTRLSWFNAHCIDTFEIYPAPQSLFHCEVILYKVPSVNSHFGSSKSPLKYCGYLEEL